MKELIISLPMLPQPLGASHGNLRRRQRDEEKKWQDYIGTEWAGMGKPKFNTVHVTLIFSFPDQQACDLVAYLATGSKLVGDAIKGFLITDVGPECLTAWNFRCEFGKEPGTTVIIEEERRVSDTWQRPDCNFYETCNTPFCPLDQTSLEGSWYPDEEICRSRTQGNLPWIKAQKKIAGSGAQANRYFNLPMLNRNCIIRQGITGLDPDKEEGSQLKKWMAEHPEKRDMSEEEIMMRKKLAQKCLNLGDGKSPSEGV